MWGIILSTFLGLLNNKNTQSYIQFLKPNLRNSLFTFSKEPRLMELLVVFEAFSILSDLVGTDSNCGHQLI